MKAASKAHSRMCLFTQYVGTLWKSLLQDAVDTTSSQGLKPAKQMCGKRTKNATKILSLPQKVPQITNCGTLGNIWEMYRYTFAFK